ncbi:hypothetical protein [Gordonia polyisoprenivorans]|uniref:hypothetical protein n=1 Tax=Gordonia polyisoprenivorans TaxID=84595 RepID=UPI001AD61FED|nr:hypothetical protein [Gordonia polyisoprenivorans]QTI67385.1 hypothetical protein J6U32_17440 [Gordonia polyisoprenivorans]
MMAELDYGSRGKDVFSEFQGRVARPTVLLLQDLQLLEGIGDYTPVDVVPFLYEWRKFPVPIPLQTFLEIRGMPRPLPQHLLAASKQLNRRLGESR